MFRIRQIKEDDEIRLENIINDQERRIAAAMSYLDRINSSGDAHFNFHGIAAAANLASRIN